MINTQNNFLILQKKSFFFIDAEQKLSLTLNDMQNWYHVNLAFDLI